ncbi:hypothetical protein ACHAWF_014107 [Thalassiosira exigua]
MHARRLAKKLARERRRLGRHAAFGTHPFNPWPWVCAMLVNCISALTSWLSNALYEDMVRIHGTNKHAMFSPHKKIYRLLLLTFAPKFITSFQSAKMYCEKQSLNKKRMMASAVEDMEFSHDVEDEILIGIISRHMKRKRISRIKKSAAKNRKYRQRKSWAEFQSKLTDKQFRRYFRMSRECFQLLCEKIQTNVGERSFKSEQYLADVREGNVTQVHPLLKSMIHCHDESTGGFICGEIKLALTLRLLAGGSYLDLALLFECGWSHAYNIFHEVLEKWILDDKFVQMNGVEYCTDVERMKNVATDFSRTSNGVINGCIGAIDGWIVKIARPTKKDGVYNPGSFYSRKGFYGINVQAIVDKKKRILYRNILSRGAEHDSTAFKNGQFFKWLIENWSALARHGFYFIGDSAYSLQSFLLTPFDNVLHGTPEDNYNFFHSSSRISVECAFGEIDLRWGILWRPLKFTLKHNINVIDACMRLHNFIVDYREATRVISDVEEIDRAIFDDDCRRYLANHPDMDEFGVFGGEEDDRLDENGNQHIGGRPTKNEEESRKHGKTVRQALCDQIAAKKLVRPPSNWYRANNRIVESQ